MEEMVTLIKFMNKEELVDMIIQIKNFRNPNTGAFHHKYRTCQEKIDDKYRMAKHRFNISNLDYVDILLLDEGYVRYRGCSEIVLSMLKCKFGFSEE